MASRRLSAAYPSVPQQPGTALTLEGRDAKVRQSYGAGQDEIQVVSGSGATVAVTGLSQLSGITQDAKPSGPVPGPGDTHRLARGRVGHQPGAVPLPKRE